MKKENTEVYDEESYQEMRHLIDSNRLSSDAGWCHVSKSKEDAGRGRCGNTSDFSHPAKTFFVVVRLFIILACQIPRKTQVEDSGMFDVTSHFLNW
jgi:hypothetical protein